jgi:hypothetical protein
MVSKKRIAQYIEDKHLADGGYFFAKVEPSSGQDTYLAVKTLRLLGMKPKHLESILRFWRQEDKDKNLDSINGLFFASQTLKELGANQQFLNHYRSYLRDQLHNPSVFVKNVFFVDGEGGFDFNNSSIAILYSDYIERELETLFYLCSLFRDFQISFDRSRIVSYLKSLQNTDGGFGSIRGSNLATTYHALSSFKILGEDDFEKEKVATYLISKRQMINYLEDWFYFIESLDLIGETITGVQSVSTFIGRCSRANGGFSRSQFIGISTIEDTYYAVSLLRVLGNSFVND